ncbi:sensor domain-containing protein [Nitratidesulfovibrio sp. 1201_IL3209]|uniref:sensor domain-containing protein n=1 Tax=Nitratidesulfovibrio sp. 1201_IL3209 TaxID=3084053 RepID=UPI002FD9A5B7
MADMSGMPGMSAISGIAGAPTHADADLSSGQPDAAAPPIQPHSPLPPPEPQPHATCVSGDSLFAGLPDLAAMLGTSPTRSVQEEPATPPASGMDDLPVMSLISDGNAEGDAPHASPASRPSPHGDLAAQFGAAGIGVCVFDPAGQLLYMNGRMADLLGCGPEDIPSLFCARMVGLEGTADVLALFLRVASGQDEGGSVRKRFLRGDGGTMLASVTLYAVHDALGLPLHVVHLVRPLDRTDRNDRGGRGSDRPDIQARRRFDDVPFPVGWSATDGAHTPGTARPDRYRAALHLIAHATLHEPEPDGLALAFARIFRSLLPGEPPQLVVYPGDGSRTVYASADAAGRRDAAPPCDLAARVYLRGETVRVDADELRELAELGECLLSDPVPAHWLGVPLRTRTGEVLGAIVCRVEGEDDAGCAEAQALPRPAPARPRPDFSAEDRRLLELVSGHVADALAARRDLGRRALDEVRFRASFMDAVAGMALLDAGGRLLAVNRAFEAAFGYPDGVLAGTELRDLLPPDVAGQALREFGGLWLSVSAIRAVSAMGGSGEATGARVETSWPFLRADGEKRWMQQSLRILPGEAGHPPCALLQVTPLEGGNGRAGRDPAARDEERMTQTAFHDVLTGLPNRVLLLDRVESALKRARRHDHYRFAVLFLDIDRFKVVNESLGHRAGDELLRLFSDRVLPCLREVDTLARCGGDEFAVLLDDVEDMAEVGTIVERIQDALRTPFPVHDTEVYMAASIGVVVRARQYTSAEDILRDADLAMFRAKESGKGRYELFDEDVAPAAPDKLRRENELRRAMERGEIELYFQPVVSLRTARITGLEALVRWNHPELGLLTPSDFIPLAEESGLIYHLDRHVLELGCASVRALRERAGPAAEFALNLNISARSFRRWNMVESYSAVILESGCNPLDVRLEITESLLLTGVDSVTDKLWKFKELGVSLVLDDFGTGYSSLNYLRQFPMDMIKIDKSFTSRVHEEKAAYGIVQSIVSLGRGLGLGVVAEGIERPEQAEVLLELGCLYAQGFLYSRPLPFERTVKVLERRSPLPLSAG